MKFRHFKLSKQVISAMPIFPAIYSSNHSWKICLIILSLTHYTPMFHLHTLWKCQKTKVFWSYSGCKNRILPRNGLIDNWRKTHATWSRYFLNEIWVSTIDICEVLIGWTGPFHKYHLNNSSIFTCLRVIFISMIR